MSQKFVFALASFSLKKQQAVTSTVAVTYHILGLSKKKTSLAILLRLTFSGAPNIVFF